MESLAGKTALLTGASRGIGAVVARALADEGVTVIGVARSEGNLAKVFADVTAITGKSRAVPFDVTNLEQLPRLIETVHELAGPIDLLVNNAGIERWAAFQHYDLDDIQAVLATNLVAAMELTRLVLPEMLAAGHGHVVNIASLSGKKADPYNSLYSASKAGMIGWTDALRQELHGTGVGVSLVSPGPVAAGMFADHGGRLPALAATCAPTEVSKAVIKAIRRDSPEIVVNGGMAKILFAMAEFSPRVGDIIYRLIGVPKLNEATAKDMAVVGTRPVASS
jgi:short-subunit dehydrogenase